MDGPKVGRHGKVVENVATNGVKLEEELCKSIMKGSPEAIDMQCWR